MKLSVMLKIQELRSKDYLVALKNITIYVKISIESMDRMQREAWIN